VETTEEFSRDDFDRKIPLHIVFEEDVLMIVTEVKESILWEWRSFSKISWIELVSPDTINVWVGDTNTAVELDITLYSKAIWIDMLHC
jgi:hypothetical protein